MSELAAKLQEPLRKEKCNKVREREKKEWRKERERERGIKSVECKQAADIISLTSYYWKEMEMIFQV